MSTIFARTVAKAISDYRQFLRKYLKQSDRVRKLGELNLKDPQIYEDELKLYEIAWSIVKDIEENVKIPDQNYYSYSGIAKFCEHLKNYLKNYEIEDGKITHRTQKASRALIRAIQLLALPKEHLNENVATTFDECNEVIAIFGSPEQHELHINTLEKHRFLDEMFYQSIIDSFKERINMEVRIDD